MPNRWSCLCWVVGFLLIGGIVEGSDLMRQFYSSRHDDPCYSNILREPKYCEPNFVNAAFERPVLASSTCGATPKRLCEGLDGSGECTVCDQTQTAYSHPADLITDHDGRNVTCWMSDLFPLRRQPYNVSIQVSLGKKFQVTYISILFCFMRADSFALYKSADFGNTWESFQFYSSRCMDMYRIQPTEMQSNDGYGNPSGGRAQCSEMLSNIDPTSRTRVNFSPLQHSGSVFQPDENSVDDWSTVTDLKIVFSRLTMADYSENEDKQFGYYSVRDLVIGGRCQCNGHASQCVVDEQGQLTCICKHNTVGRDCESCKPFHVDRPWAPGKSGQPNACQPCNCNMHATRCRFDRALYHLSGRRSGGVCVNCRHNTAGRYCHYCREGYYRDHTKPITHKRFCRPCGCHTIGALSTTCNQTTGQCFCKDGVTGTRCNRCAPGYQQSRSAIMPCIRIPGQANDFTYDYEDDINGPGSPVDGDRSPSVDGDVVDECQARGKCRALDTKFSLKKFCSAGFVIKATVITKEPASGGFIRFVIDVQRIFKDDANQFRTGLNSILVDKTDFQCKCPKIKPKNSYLLVSDFTVRRSLRSASAAGGVVPQSTEAKIDRKSTVIRWQNDFERRLRRFQRKQLKKCSTATSPSVRSSQPQPRAASRKRNRRYYYSYRDFRP